ncbi:MAG: gliding motility-associated C-terminal domain-containing protein [Bacteroidales bacterium]|nr:gliding motility-associated C-terminal domain-containing protein [Bacteroidales bacterium]
MKTIAAVILLFGTCFFLQGQTTFQKRYAIGNTFDFLTSVIQNADRSYTMAGYDVNIGAYGIDLVKVDSTGVVQWAKTYHSGSLFFPYSDYYQLGKLIKTSDGGYVACGTRKTDFLIMKLDANGNLTWAKNYNNGGTSHYLNSIKETSDGGFVACGYIRQTANDSLNAFIIKVTNNGTLSWGGTWNNNAFNADDVFNDVVEDPGNGFIAVGYTNQVFNSGNDTTQDVLVVKIATNGSFTWGYTMGDDNQDEVAQYIIKNGSNFYLTGYTTYNAIGQDLFFMEMTGSGTQNFCKKYNYGLTDWGMKILPLTSGYSILGGDIFLGGNIIKIDVDATGNFLSGYSYSGNFSFPINIDGQKTLDNGWVFGTMASDYTYYLLKANSSGSTGCYESTFNSSTTTITLTSTNYSGSYLTGASSGNPSITVTAFNIDTMVTDCQFIPCDTPLVSITPPAATICQGQNTTLTASGSNGSGSCTSYSWNSGQTTASINVSPTNTTTYTVVGYVGTCPSHPTSVTVTVNPIPIVSISGDNNICVGESTTLTASGGNSYIWSNGGNTNSIVVSPVNTTIYNVTATNTYSCTSTANYQVTVNPLPTASISGNNTSCAGISVTLTASGGDQYIWNNGNSNASITVNPSTTTSYQVTVTNTTTGCTATASHTINVNPNPTVYIAGDTIICEGTSTTLTASGADTYSWSTGSNTNSITISPPLGTTQYYVTATNTTTGCSTVRAITVQVVSAPVVQFAGNTNICIGQTTTITASGGNAYTWNNGSHNASINVSPSTTTMYYVTVSAGSCQTVDSIQVVVNPLPTVSITGPNSVCEGNSISLTATGGTTYLWNTSETNNTINVSPSTTTTYSVTVTDNTTQCSATANHTVTVNSNPTITFSGNTSICENETTTITASGGNQYLWNTGETTNSITVSPHVGQTIYSVTVTNISTQCSATSSVTVTVNASPTAIAGNDTTICSGTSAQLHASGGVSYVWFPTTTLNSSTTATPLATPSDTTTYSVVVTNAQGCKDTATVTVNVAKINSINIVSTSVNCPEGHDGALSVSSISGVLPFTYNWSNGQTTSSINNLAAGTYQLTITDGMGCTYSYSATVTQPASFNGTTNIQDVSCFNGNNGAISLTIIGGTSPYTYIWNNGNQTNNPTNLSAGNYNVTVTDSHNCTYIINDILVNQPASALNYTLDSIKHASCYNGNDGLIIIHGTGGTAPYQYHWSNGTNVNSIAFLTAGNYYVTITDNYQCSFTETFTIQQPEAIVVHSNIVDASCIDGKDGKIEIIITGGEAPYNYLWSNGTTLVNAENIGSGNYELTITDNKNCQQTAQFTVHAEQTECLLIPELITPNGDNVNDYFAIKGIEYFQEVDIEIYNRWGNKIFTYSGSGSAYANPTNQWNGKYKDKDECSPCSFIYIVNVHNGRKPYQGIVTVKK